MLRRLSVISTLVLASSFGSVMPAHAGLTGATCVVTEVTISYSPNIKATTTSGWIGLDGVGFCAGDDPIGVTDLTLGGGGPATIMNCGLVVASGLFDMDYGNNPTGTFVYVGTVAGGQLVFTDLSPTGVASGDFATVNDLTVLPACAGAGLASVRYLGSLTFVDP